jgi:hypothetical protein
MTILLRTNTKQVRDELKRMGYRLCPCCYSRGFVWLFCETDRTWHSDVHGIPKSGRGEMLAGNDFTDCKTDKKMFLNLAKNNRK